jgi:hypothetical protein
MTDFFKVRFFLLCSESIQLIAMAMADFFKKINIPVALQLFHPPD